MTKTTPKRIAVIVSVTLAACGPFIYALVSDPYVRCRCWSEGKAVAGSIAKMLCEYAKVEGPNGNYPPSWQELLEVCEYDCSADELFGDGYFKKDCFSYEAAYDKSLTPPVRFRITVTAPKGRKPANIKRYHKVILNHEGAWEEYENEKGA